MSDGFALLSALSERMRWLGQRQGAVAENIAASDVAGYRAKDVTAPNFAAMIGRHTGATAAGGPSVRLSARMAALGGGAAIHTQERGQERGTGTVKPNDNDVSLEDELLTMADIQMEHAAVANLYRKQIGLVKIALGRSGR